MTFKIVVLVLIPIPAHPHLHGSAALVTVL